MTSFAGLGPGKPLRFEDAPDSPRSPGWLLGHNPARSERLLVGATAAVGTLAALLLAARDGVEWAWWHWLVVAVVAVDLIGGPVANSLRGARALYHSPLPAGANMVQRCIHNRLGFTALHIQPFVVVAVLPGGGWLWAMAVYGFALAGVAAIVAAPAGLARQSGFAMATLALVCLPAAPAGLAWLGYVQIVKLVLAHALPHSGRPETGSRLG